MEEKKKVIFLDEEIKELEEKCRKFCEEKKGLHPQELLLSIAANQAVTIPAMIEKMVTVMMKLCDVVEEIVDLQLATPEQEVKKPNGKRVTLPFREIFLDDTAK